MNNIAFYYCENNQTQLVDFVGSPALCQLPGLELLNAKSQDTGSEKHVPILHYESGLLQVHVGGQAHPMQPEHYIEWIFLQTRQGGMYQKLSPNSEPKASFVVNASDVVGVYAYCNIHGLWKGSLAEQIDAGFHELVCSAEFSECIDS